MGNAQSNPTIGKPEEFHCEAETRISVIFPKHLRKNILQALFTHHPYEEVAYELYTLENSHQHIGLGMIGFLEEPMAKKLSVEPLVLGTALFGGAFIAGWLSFAGNSLIDIINSNFIKDPVVFNDWTNALTAPFAEEFFKALTAFAALYILGRRDI